MNKSLNRISLDICRTSSCRTSSRSHRRNAGSCPRWATRPSPSCARRSNTPAPTRACCQAYLDLEEMKRDLGAVDVLVNLQRPLDQLLAGLDDSVLTAGSEVYSAALAYYQAVKGAARARVQGAEAIADDLGERFPGRRRTRGGEAPA
jgi:hypothetical protein